MSTDDIREAADDMDEDAFIPRMWLIIAANGSGSVATIWPQGQGGTIEMLAAATAAVREQNGAPGRTQ
jgi:hypothetical protein